MKNSEVGAPYGVSASLVSEKCVIGEIRSEFPWWCPVHRWPYPTFLFRGIRLETVKSPTILWKWFTIQRSAISWNCFIWRWNTFRFPLPLIFKPQKQGDICGLHNSAVGEHRVKCCVHTYRSQLDTHVSQPSGTYVRCDSPQKPFISGFAIASIPMKPQTLRPAGLVTLLQC